LKTVGRKPLGVRVPRPPLGPTTRPPQAGRRPTQMPAKVPGMEVRRRAPAPLRASRPRRSAGPSRRRVRPTTRAPGGRHTSGDLRRGFPLSGDTAGFRVTRCDVWSTALILGINLLAVTVLLLVLLTWKEHAVLLLGFGAVDAALFAIGLRHKTSWRLTVKCSAETFPVTRNGVPLPPSAVSLEVVRRPPHRLLPRGAAGGRPDRLPRRPQGPGRDRDPAKRVGSQPGHVDGVDHRVAGSPRQQRSAPGSVGPGERRPGPRGVVPGRRRILRRALRHSPTGRATFAAWARARARLAASPKIRSPS
jgi:hypothetical protein